MAPSVITQLRHPDRDDHFHGLTLFDAELRVEILEFPNLVLARGIDTGGAELRAKGV